MKAVNVLGDGYREIYSVNMQKDKKLALRINVIATLISFVMVIVANMAIPFSSLTDTEDGMSGFAVRLAVFAVSYIAYIVLHEAVHGIAMKLCGTKKVKYGFTGLYAFAGSADYYDKSAYIFIALAPVVLWGIVLTVINILVPVSWFWVVYAVQIFNLGGAAGDYYVTAKFCRFPKDILVKDAGVSMTVYSKEQN